MQAVVGRADFGAGHWRYSSSLSFLWRQYSWVDYVAMRDNAKNRTKVTVALFAASCQFTIPGGDRHDVAAWLLNRLSAEAAIFSLSVARPVQLAIAFATNGGDANLEKAPLSCTDCALLNERDSKIVIPNQSHM